MVGAAIPTSRSRSPILRASIPLPAIPSAASPIILSDRSERAAAGTDRVRPGLVAPRCRTVHHPGIAVRALFVAALPARSTGRIAVQRRRRNRRSSRTSRSARRRTRCIIVGDRTHTLRGGLSWSRATAASARPSTSVFPVDGTGAQTGQPITIADNSGKTAMTLQRLSAGRMGARPHADAELRRAATTCSTATATRRQFSPRANLVWQPDAKLTAHVGYARYFVPPPFELVGNSSVAALQGHQRRGRTQPGQRHALCGDGRITTMSASSISSAALSPSGSMDIIASR